MKHLKQLEEAGLVVTRRRGREKLHFLNPVPIRLVHDRWVSKYAEPWVATLSGLKQRLESPMEKVFEIYIRTTPERLWEATKENPERLWEASSIPTSEQVQLRRRHGGPRAEARRALRDDRPQGGGASWARARSSRSTRPGGSSTPWRRTSATRRRPRGRRGSRGRSSPSGDSCHLTLTHDQLREGANAQLYGGWPMVLSGLKTWLESGELLTTPGRSCGLTHRRRPTPGRLR